MWTFKKRIKNLISGWPQGREHKCENKTGQRWYPLGFFLYAAFSQCLFNYKVKKIKPLAFCEQAIDRPNYSTQSRFLFLIDVTTYATGNPSLLPQFTWSYELSYYHENINITFGYSHTSKNQNVVIARFKEVFPNIPADDNITVQIPVNLTSSDYYGVTIAAYVRITKWWNMMNNANLFYNHFNGNLSGTTLNNGRVAVNLSTNQTVTLKKDGQLKWAEIIIRAVCMDLHLFVRNGQWVQGTKTFWKEKGQVQLNVSDIFWTNLPRGTITYNNYVEYWRAYRETRVANLSPTYRFGSNKIQQARRRTLGSEEERQRAQ